MNQLLNHYLVIDGTAAAVPDTKLENIVSISMTAQLSLTAEDYQRIQADMRELVRLRNTLVHHFLEQHDLWSLSGCNQAAKVLTQANAFVHRHIEQLHVWAKSLDETRSKLATFINSEPGYDLLVDGIAPDGEMHWPYAGCVQALRAAAKVLAVDGWTSVAAAEKWIAQHHPEQKPSRYGCVSWRQVIQESQLFDSRRREVDGQQQQCYQPRPEASK